MKVFCYGDSNTSKADCLHREPEAHKALAEGMYEAVMEVSKLFPCLS